MGDSDSAGMANGRSSRRAGGGFGGGGARFLPLDAKERLDVDMTEVRFVGGWEPWGGMRVVALTLLISDPAGLEQKRGE